jgi:hypothetical protein
MGRHAPDIAGDTRPSTSGVSNVRKSLILAGLAGLLALTACGKEATSSSAPAGSPTESSAPTTTSSSPAAPTTPAGPELPADLVLGPDGLGQFKLGMTPAAAEAAGLVLKDTGVAACPKAAELTLPDRRVTDLQFSAKLGLATIEAKGDVHTPEGIKVSATLADVKKAYPALKNNFDDPKFTGDNTAPVAGNPKAKYLLFMSGKVSRLHLALADYDCPTS